MPNFSEKYFPIVEQLQGSGLSARAFCVQQGINPHTLSYWKKRYRDHHQQPLPQPKGFAAINITGVASMQISIEYKDGTTVTFSGASDVLVVKQFIPALIP